MLVHSVASQTWRKKGVSNSFGGNILVPPLYTNLDKSMQALVKGVWR